MAKPVQVPFPPSTAPGSRPQESGGRLVNCYVEKLAKTAAWPQKFVRAPGLDDFGTSARTGFRAAFTLGGVLYTAFDGQLEKWSSAGGASSNVGALTGSAKGMFAANNASPPDMVFVATDGDIATFTDSAVTNGYPDVDLPAVNGVCSINGYLVFTTGDGKAYATGLNTTSVDALSFGPASSKPDGLVRPIAFANTLLLFGTQSTEIWADQGLSPFPFTRSTMIPRGLAGPHAIAGQEDGWGKELLFVGDDSRVHKLVGYEAVPVSSPDLETLIEAADKTLLEASVYMSRGHAFWQLSSPTWTWVYDLTTGGWHERTSYGLARSRITGGIQAFDRWLVGDTQTGNMLELYSDFQDEVGSPLRFRLESGPVEHFPAGAIVGRADFFFVTGVGEASGIDPTETDPTVEISWSDDGGQTWSAPALRKLGRQAVTAALVSLIAETGRSSWNGRRWRIDITDSVYASFMGATQSTDPRAHVVK